MTKCSRVGLLLTKFNFSPELARALQTHNPPSKSGLIPTTLRVPWCTSTTGREWKTCQKPRHDLSTLQHRHPSVGNQCDTLRTCSFCPCRAHNMGVERTLTTNSTVIAMFVVRTVDSNECYWFSWDGIVACGCLLNFLNCPRLSRAGGVMPLWWWLCRTPRRSLYICFCSLQLCHRTLAAAATSIGWEV